MAFYSIGDQARAFALQTASSRLKTSLGTLTDELASGQVADVGQRLQGNTQALSAIESQLNLVTQHRHNAAEQALRLTGMQDRLAHMQALTSELGVSLMAPPFTETVGLVAMRAAAVSDDLTAVVSLLNGKVAGAQLFSGQALDRPPLSSGPAILDELESLTSGLATAADVAAAVDDWFDAPQGGGGFLDSAYFGTLNAPLTVVLNEGRRLDNTTDAASAPIREALKGLATAALVDRGVLGGQYGEQRALMQMGGQVLVGNDADLLAEMAQIGNLQQYATRAEAEHVSELTVLQMARNEIRSADPFETAGALKQVEAQLEMLYTVTARLSRLTLTEYLR